MRIKIPDYVDSIFDGLTDKYTASAKEKKLNNILAPERLFKAISL